MGGFDDIVVDLGMRCLFLWCFILVGLCVSVFVKCVVFRSVTILVEEVVCR